MISATIPPAADQVAQLLAVIADPEASAKRLADLTTATRHNEIMIERLAEAQKAHDKREAELLALRDVKETEARIAAKATTDAAKATTDAAKADAARIRSEVERLHTEALGEYQTVADARAAAEAAEAAYKGKLAALTAAVEAAR